MRDKFLFSRHEFAFARQVLQLFFSCISGVVRQKVISRRRCSLRLSY